VASLQELSVRDRPAPGAVAPRVRRHLEQAAAQLDSVRRTLVGALDTLPRDPDCAAVARQLRELATVSPSLMEWLKQVPKVSTPLAASAKGLQDAAAGLESARGRLEEAIRELWPAVRPDLAFQLGPARVELIDRGLRLRQRRQALGQRLVVRGHRKVGGGLAAG
jgi:ABC-type transporter Mla subunit MlaD